MRMIEAHERERQRIRQVHEHLENQQKESSTSSRTFFASVVFAALRSQLLLCFGTSRRARARAMSRGDDPPLVHQLVEGVLPVGAGLAPDDRPGRAADGLAVTRSTNSLTDVFDGYQLDLNAVNSSTTNVSSSIAATDARDRMQSFIDHINSVKTYLTTETKRGLDGAPNGSLVGDITAQAILREISGLTTDPIAGYGASSVYLASLGVQTERDGTLRLDTTKFDSAIVADPGLADIVFSSKYSTTSPNTTVTGSTSYPPKAGSYSFVYSSGNTATINGETVTKIDNANGQKVFTAANGDADNTSVTLLTDTATNATVRYGQSVIDRLQAYITNITSSTGSIKTRTTSLSEELSAFADEQTDLDAKIESLTTDYNVKFGSMEALVTQLNKTGEYLTSMMDAWNKKD